MADGSEMHLKYHNNGGFDLDLDLLAAVNRPLNASQPCNPPRAR